MQIESKFLGVIRNNVRYGYGNYCIENFVVILTPYNYFDWNPKAVFQLRKKGLYNLTMAAETEPTSAIEKMRWENRKDEATGILLELISINLWFHVAA